MKARRVRPPIYAQDVAERFRRGQSPADVPKEDYEVEWSNRFTESQLNETSTRGLGMSRSTKVSAEASATRR